MKPIRFFVVATTSCGLHLAKEAKMTDVNACLEITDDLVDLYRDDDSYTPLEDKILEFKSKIKDDHGLTSLKRG